LNIETAVDLTPNAIRDLTLLEEIEQDPDVNQAALASQLGVAVGTVNWHMKRLIAKGAIKVKRATRRKLRYIITPDGIALRAVLALDFVSQSFKLYRLMRTRSIELIPRIRDAGYEQVNIHVNGDTADIIRLTCLEHGIEVSDKQDIPYIEMTGLKLNLHLPGETTDAE